MDTKNMKNNTKKTFTLKEKRAKIKQDKLDKKISRLADDKLKNAKKTLDDITRLTMKESNECVTGFIQARNEGNEKKMQRFADRFISVDRRLHEVIKNDNWSEEKAYETFDMLLEEAVKAIVARMMDSELKEDALNILKEEIND